MSRSLGPSPERNVQMLSDHVSGVSEGAKSPPPQSPPHSEAHAERHCFQASTYMLVQFSQITS